MRTDLSAGDVHEPLSAAALAGENASHAGECAHLDLDAIAGLERLRGFVAAVTARVKPDQGSSGKVPYALANVLGLGRLAGREDVAAGDRSLALALALDGQVGAVPGLAQLLGGLEFLLRGNLEGGKSGQCSAPFRVTLAHGRRISSVAGPPMFP